jgi:hypothetical protein
MGNQASQTTINSSEITTKAVTEAYLSIVQNISQGIYSSQNISVDCYSDTKNKFCMECIDFWANYNKSKTKDKQLSLPQIREVCEGICECKLFNTDLKQNINVKFTSFLQDSSKEEFKKQVMNSLNQQANSSANSFYPTETRTSNINKTLNNLYTAMSSKTFQNSLQGIKTLQNIDFSGPGEISNINLSQISNFISNILISNKSTSDIMSQLINNVQQLSMSITDASLAAFALIIVQIIVLVIIIIALQFLFSLIMQVYSLYVS